MSALLLLAKDFADIGRWSGFVTDLALLMPPTASGDNAVPQSYSGAVRVPKVE